MAGFDPLQFSEDLIEGRRSIVERHPLSTLSNQLSEVADGVGWVESLANVAVFSTDEGLVLVDVGGLFVGEAVRSAVRSWSKAPVDTAIYTHGHVDHVAAAPVWDEEAAGEGRNRIRVIAHTAVEERFERYRLTRGWNTQINRRQFRVGEGLEWPENYRHPDVCYTERLEIGVGGVHFELHHSRGETDDHTWVFVPDRRILCTGDLFIWASPNAGNPQKVQRYARDWAIALREMASLEPQLLLPGHGLPIAGVERVGRVLRTTAELLEHLHDRTVEMMNAGATLDEVIHSVGVPDHLRDLPWLQPVYDEPEFVVRNVWRLYGGWYDGNPAHLKPAPQADLGSEIARLVGGVDVLVSRALELSRNGDDRLACHLVELAWHADRSSESVRRARAEVYGRRAERETSTMARGIFAWAKAEAEREDV
ncbi:MAG: MBL fold metallo-hydrolase [Acidimicrobiales bacterium]|nr:MAG: MBL fold metallo-hydrolase [Acidimicrobiales bacterium]